MEDIKSYQDNEIKQEKTPQQKEGMIPLDDIKALYNNLEHNAKLVLKKNTLTYPDLNDIINNMILIHSNK